LAKKIFTPLSWYQPCNQFGFNNDTFCLYFWDPILENLHKERAVREPSLLKLSEVAKGLGLDIEGSELMAYRGGF